MGKYKVLFCDLDGTLINTVSGETFPKGIWDMKFRFDVLDAIKNLAPDYVFIVSNQGGIEKGYVSYQSILHKVLYVSSCLRDYCEIRLPVRYAFCAYNDKDNKDRKPNTGMLDFFYHDYIGGNDFNKRDALMIGDASGLPGQFSDSDKKTAENFGIDYMDVEEFIKSIKK